MLWGGCHGNVTRLILYPSPKRTGSPRTLSPEAAFVSQLSGAEITSAAAACPADWEAAWDSRDARGKKPCLICKLDYPIGWQCLLRTFWWNHCKMESNVAFLFRFDWIFTSCKVRRLKTYQGFSLKENSKHVGKMMLWSRYTHSSEEYKAAYKVLRMI